MSIFDPRGSYPWQAMSISDALLAKTKAFYKTLEPLPDNGSLSSIYLHWSASPDMCDPDAQYNAEATYVNGDWQMARSTSIVGNALGDPVTEAPHTYHRNSHAVGIALAGMENATPDNFGPEAVTHAGIDTLLAMAAAVALKYDIDVEGMTSRHDASYAPVVERCVFTHAEAAVVDGYYPGMGQADCRWDLASLIALPPGVALSESYATIVGNALRTRAHNIKLILEHG